MKTTGVIVARFQTPYLHEGHTYLLQAIRQQHHKMVIVLGVSPVKASRHNPFDFYTREKMLKQYDSQLVVLPLSDHVSDKVWSQQLDGLLKSAFPSESFILYGSRDCFIPYYSGHLSVAELPEFGDRSATAIRDENSDRVLDTTDFRMGINYACHNMYAKVYPTVDIAVLKDDHTMVLLGKKPGVQAWRFPGGFTDPTDDTYEMAAKRELTEECGAIETGEMQYVGSAKIDDWRYRSEDDKILSLLFTTTLLSGQVKASDDLAELSWFPVQSLNDMMAKAQIVREHHVLIHLLLKKLQHQ